MLEVKNLSTYFKQGDSTVKAVDNVSFSVAKGEILGLVGESGSGKSTIAHSILKLIPASASVSGEIIFENRNLLQLAEPELIKIRGSKISMIFQDPFTSLNPVLTIGEQIAEVLRFHQGMNRQQARDRAIELLETVRIRNSGLRVRDYPHQFSGGMQQRVMIAIALACEPEFLIADEPTTALDVTIQAEILRLIVELKEKFNLGIMYITHNFGIVKNICQRVVVLNKGRVVEEGETGQIFSNPQQAYTQRLIECLRVLTPPPTPSLSKRGGGVLSADGGELL